MNTDISVTKDRGESVAMMEPLLLSEGSRHREALIDLAVELAARSAGFRRSLPEDVLTALADLVRAGHDTHPVVDDLLWVDEADTGERMRVIPGEPRQRDVRVGQYIPISAGALPRFLEKFESIYSGPGESETILATRRSAGRCPGY